MGFFIDKHHRRKSSMAVTAFFAALIDLFVFGILYGVLSEPLYRLVRLGSEASSTVVQGILIALLGTALCCLQFLLRDKRIAPYGFAGLAVALLMFYVGASFLDADVRSDMLRLITLFGLLPVLVGNAVSWGIFLALKRRNPQLVARRKTLPEEIRAAAEASAAKEPRKKAAQTAPQPAAPVPQAETPAAAPGPQAAQDAALFGPEGAGGPMSGRSVQEEAMLLYMDDDDDETSDH